MTRFFQADLISAFAALTLLLLAPTAAHAQQDAINALFSGTSWILSSDDLVLPEGGAALELAKDAEGRPIALYPMGGNFKPPRPQPHFPTTKAGKTEMSLLIGYEKGEIALVCPLPDAEAETEQMDCQCTQAGKTVPCTMRQKQ